MFSCSKCGSCCRNLHKSSIYDSLHNGTGKCKYLKGNLCSIYFNRPILCRVDESYEVYFKEIIPREQYYEMNMNACKLLKTEKGK